MISRPSKRVRCSHHRILKSIGYESKNMDKSYTKNTSAVQIVQEVYIGIKVYDCIG